MTLRCRMAHINRLARIAYPRSAQPHARRGVIQVHHRVLLSSAVSGSFAVNSTSDRAIQRGPYSVRISSREELLSVLRTVSGTLRFALSVRCPSFPLASLYRTTVGFRNLTTVSCSGERAVAALDGVTPPAAGSVAAGAAGPEGVAIVTGTDSAEGSLVPSHPPRQLAVATAATTYALKTGIGCEGCIGDFWILGFSNSTSVAQVRRRLNATQFAVRTLAEIRLKCDPILRA